MRLSATKQSCRHISTSCLLLLAAPIVALGCGEDDVDPTCTWVHDRDKECGASGETGSGAEEDEDAATYEPCSATGGTIERTVFQCEGSLRASLDFNYDDGNCEKHLGADACNEFHEFGEEDYNSPKVMACCDLGEASDDDILYYCGVDLVEQFCGSMHVRINAMVADGTIPWPASIKAGHLSSYLRSHQQDCYDALYRQTDAGELQPGVWKLPEGKWSPLRQVSISLDYAEIHTASTPDDSELLSCFDGGFNNTEVFKDTVLVPPNIGDVLALSEAHGPTQVYGPTIAGQRIVGFGDLATDNSVMTVSMSPELPAWTLHEFEVFAEAPVEVHYGDLTVPVERAAVRQYGSSQGRFITGRYEIDPGEAHFLVSGVTHGDAGVRWMHNRSPIVMLPSAGGWAIEAFELEHVDVNDKIWTVVVPATDWR